MLAVQEEIKIISVEVYVNPYAESDEEEEERKTNEDKNAEDEENVSSRPLMWLLFCYVIFPAFKLLLFPFYVNNMPFWFTSRIRSVHGTAIQLRDRQILLLLVAELGSI